MVENFAPEKLMVWILSFLVFVVIFLLISIDGVNAQWCSEMDLEIGDHEITIDNSPRGSGIAYNNLTIINDRAIDTIRIEIWVESWEYSISLNHRTNVTLSPTESITIPFQIMTSSREYIPPQIIEISAYVTHANGVEVSGAGKYSTGFRVFCTGEQYLDIDVDSTINTINDENSFEIPITINSDIFHPGILYVNVINAQELQRAGIHFPETDLFFHFSADVHEITISGEDQRIRWSNWNCLIELEFILIGDNEHVYHRSVLLHRGDRGFDYFDGLLVVLTMGILGAPLVRKLNCLSNVPGCYVQI